MIFSRRQASGLLFLYHYRPCFVGAAKQLLPTISLSAYRKVVQGPAIHFHFLAGPLISDPGTLFIFKLNSIQ
jgi:hypothetical protein